MKYLSLILLAGVLMGCASNGRPSGSMGLARAPHANMRGTVQDPRFMGSARGGEGFIDPHQE
jgi:hypothetical protein